MYTKYCRMFDKAHERQQEETNNITLCNYIKVARLFFTDLIDENCSTTITKHLFPLIAPIFPVLFEFDKKRFDCQSNRYTDVFLRKYKTLVISECARVSPVDGLLIESRRVRSNTIHINQHPILLSSLFGEFCMPKLRGYCYSVLYLRPSDYHYVHFPITCQVRNIINIPGRYTWMEPSIEFGAKFLGRNFRRAYVLQDSKTKKMHYLVMIASIIVGGIRNLFTNDDASYCDSEFYNRDVSKLNLICEKGDYLARFEIGSMVVYLHNTEDSYEESPFSWERCVKVGQPLN